MQKVPLIGSCGLTKIVESDIILSMIKEIGIRPAQFEDLEALNKISIDRQHRVILNISLSKLNGLKSTV